MRTIRLKFREHTLISSATKLGKSEGKEVEATAPEEVAGTQFAGR